MADLARSCNYFTFCERSSASRSGNLVLGHPRVGLFCVISFGYRNSTRSLSRWPARCARSATVQGILGSLSENCEGCCGEGFWMWARRRGRSIPAAGCDARANAVHGQKTRRLEGFCAKGRLAALLLGRRPMKGILPRHASPSNPLPKNSTPRNFQAGS